MLYQLSYLAAATQCTRALRLDCVEIGGGHSPRAAAFLDQGAEVRGELLPLIGRECLLHRFTKRGDSWIARTVEKCLPAKGVG